MCVSRESIYITVPAIMPDRSDSTRVYIFGHATPENLGAISPQVHTVRFVAMPSYEQVAALPDHVQTIEHRDYSSTILLGMKTHVKFVHVPKSQPSVSFLATVLDLKEESKEPSRLSVNKKF